MGIEQQLSGDIVDALYAANTPSSSNPIATLADVTSSAGNVVRKILNTTDEIINFNVVSGSFTNFFSTTIVANDPDVTDGRELLLEGMCIFNKTTNGNTTYEVEFNIAGTSVVTTTFTVGAPTILNQTHRFELRINFRTTNSSRVYCNYKRENTTTNLASYTPTLLTVPFNKTINNNISMGIRIVANATNNNMTRELTSLIIK